MITRIPQPQFVGPAPSEVNIQEADYGQRIAQIFAQGMAEGQRNYIAQKQNDVEKQKAQALAGYNQEMADTRKQGELDNTTQLKLKVLGQQLDDGLKQAGPGHEAEYYLDNYDRYKQFFNMAGNGDKDFTNSMLQGLSKSIGSMSPTSMARRGMFDINYEGTAPTAQAPGAPGTPAQPPGAPPMTFGAGPAPQAASTTPQSEVALAHPLPENASEMTPDLINTIAGNKTLMDAYRKSLIASGATGVLPTADAGKNAALLGNTKDAFAKFATSLPDAQKASLVGTTSGAGGAISITEMTKGLPQNAATKTAAQALQVMATGDPNATITPKQQSALKAVTGAKVSVLANSTAVKDWLSKGGTQEYADKMASSLQTALQDPKYESFFKQSVAMPEDMAKDFAAYTAQDNKAGAAADSLQEKYAGLDEKSAALKVTAANYLLAREASQQRLSELRQTASTAAGKLALQQVEDVGKLADSMTSHYVVAANNFRTSLKGKSNDEITKAIANAEADSSSPVGQTLLRAAQMTLAYRQALGDTNATLDSITTEISGTNFLGLLQLTPDKTLSIPSLSGSPGSAPQKPASTAPQAPAAAGPPAAGGLNLLNPGTSQGAPGTGNPTVSGLINKWGG